MIGFLLFIIFILGLLVNYLNTMVENLNGHMQKIRYSAFKMQEQHLSNSKNDIFGFSLGIEESTRKYLELNKPQPTDEIKLLEYKSDNNR